MVNLVLALALLGASWWACTAALTASLRPNRRRGADPTGPAVTLCAWQKVLANRVAAKLAPRADVINPPTFHRSLGPPW